MNSKPPNSLYTILSTLHRSRLHITYLAKHRETKELSVIKTIDPKWQADPLLKQRLKDEAELNLKLNHPHIRKTIKLFEEDANLYVVYQYIEGKLLSEFLDWGRLSFSPVQVLKWLDLLIDALAHAHAKGIFHANLNPFNILVNEEGELFIYGFGKAYNSWLDDDPYQEGLHPILFLAPEVFKGGKPNASSDVYSLAILAYMMLCGRLPWSLNKDLSIKKQKESSFEKPVLNPEFLGITLPPWLFSVINKCLIIDPQNRFASIEEVKQAILLQEVKPVFSYSAPPVPAVPSAKPEVPAPVVLPPKPEVPPKLEVPAKKEAPAPVVLPAKPEGPPKPEVPPKKEVPAKVEESFPKEDIPKEKPDIPKIESIPPPKQSPVVPPAKKISYSTKEAEPQEMNPKVKRWGIIMAVATALVLIFAVLKYTVFKDKPVFDAEIISSDDDDLSFDAVPNKAIKMVFVKGDSTYIGSMAPEASADEFPPLKLKIPSFWMSSFEITNEEWAMVYPQHFYSLKERNQPVTNISFLEVLEYCNEKSYLDKLQPCYDFLNGYTCDFNASGYRLPTEAEWEFAAKEAKLEAAFSYSGSDDPSKVGWYLQNSNSELHPVGQKKPNALGLYDMSGNAYEWVWNWYAAYTKAANPLYGPETGSERVIRGGSFSHEPSEMRITKRSHVKQFTKSPYIGFRVVKKNEE